MDLKNSKDCREAYREILQGYSHLEEEGLYVKHFREPDLGRLESLYKKCAKDLESKGVDYEKDKLELLEKENHWTEEDEVGYIEAKLAVQDAYIFHDKLVDPNQKEEFKATIRAQEEVLEKVFAKRNETVSLTIENFCEKRLNEHYVRCSIFKDEKLEEPLLSPEEFDKISFSELNEMVIVYNKSADKFSQTNINRIAVNSFFLNSFMMSNDDPVKFYGKSVLELTLYQLNLYGRGKYYKSILEEGKEPPNNLYEMIDKEGLDPIVMWFDSTFNQIRAKRERDAAQNRANAARNARRH